MKLLLVLALGAGIAAASPVTYIVQVDTPDFNVTGWIDFSFVQVNSLTSLPATANIDNFQQTGYTLDSTIQTSGPGVTGLLNSPPVVIPNDENAANYFTQHVTAWGSSFRFTVTFTGAAPGNAAPDGSAFRVSLFDENFNFLVSPLADFEVANVIINPDGSLSGNGSSFDGGGASVTAAPEPGTALLGAGALAALWWRRRARA